MTQTSSQRSIAALLQMALPTAKKKKTNPSKDRKSFLHTQSGLGNLEKRKVVSVVIT